MSYKKNKKDDFDFETSSQHSQENLDIIPALKTISQIVFPSMFFFIGVYIQQTLNLIFIGHTYEKSMQRDAIDGVGISHLYINCTLLALVIGIISGFDTLGSNSFGAKRYYLFGLYFHRTILIGYTMTIVLFIFHFIFAVRILGLLGIEESVLVFVSKYIRIMMFFVIFDVQYSINFRYLNIIGKSHINLMILIVSVAVHPIWCYIFIVLLNWGVQGAALSLVLSQMFNALVGLYYIIVIKPLPESIFPINADSYKGWWEYLIIALPSAFLVCAEWMAFEITAVLAIWIGKIDYTVHILLTNLSLNIFTISFGFGISACVIVGNSICKNSIAYVKKYSIIIFLFGFILLSFICFIIFLIRKKILYIFIEDVEIIQKGQEVIIWMCLYKMADLAAGVFAGIFRGLGKQFIASKIAFVNYYITQIALAVYLGKYLELGVYGIWLGLFIGATINSLCYLYVLYNFDYKKIKEEIMLRLEYDSKLITEYGAINQEKENYNWGYEMKEIVSDKYFF